MTGEKTAGLLVITENIEMELFSSKEPYEGVTTEEKEEESSFYQGNLKHPLVPDCEEDPDLQVQIQPKVQLKPKTKCSVQEEPRHFSPAMGFMEKIEIEMDVFPPIRVSNSEMVEMKLGDSSILTQLSPNKPSHLRWKRFNRQQTKLVVKDVICLPRGLWMSRLVRQIAPQDKDRAALAAMRMTARITIDCSWSARQLESRMEMLFRGRFVNQTGQTFSFTYLQCRQGSRVLYVPDTPTEGWTGEQVLRISEQGALYILSHHDHPQFQSKTSARETPVMKRSELCQAVSTEIKTDENSQLAKQVRSHSVCRTPGEVLDLDTILRRFRKKNMSHRDRETHIQVRRRNLLRRALKVMRRPDFCFRMMPVVSFRGEDSHSHEGPLREFFRLALLELQQSCVFEGHPRCLFLTYNLAALEDQKYYEAGVLIGWSLAQGGPGPHCLHPALYKLMCCQDLTMDDFSWRDIVDAETQIRLQELHSCTDVRLLSPSLCEWISSSGNSGICAASSDEILDIYIRQVKHYIYDRVAIMISQFTEGLNSCGGLWDVVRSHWETFVPVMTSTQQLPLTLERFSQLFTVCHSRLDSRLRAAEGATVAHWERVLTLMVRQIFPLKTSLLFITGADRLPPLGLPKLISLCFYSQDVSKVRLPYASTCSLEFYLPRGVAEAVDLLVLLSKAVHEALGRTRFQAEGDGDDG